MKIHCDVRGATKIEAQTGESKDKRTTAYDAAQLIGESKSLVQQNYSVPIIYYW